MYDYDNEYDADAPEDEFDYEAACLAGEFADEPEGEDMEPDSDDYLDGDAESALASAGFGTDEDYDHYDYDCGEDW